jgi:serine/threonine protein kinase
LFNLYEYVPGISLRHLIKNEKVISIEKTKFYIACIITVLDYLHKKKIIHRDLRPEQILITKNGYVKIIDFMLSKKLINDYTYSICGTHEYYSPEMINQSGYNKSIDYWQLGILFYEMLFGYTPFIDQNPIKLYEKIKNGKLKFPKNIDINARTLIRHFLNTDIKKRLGCTKKGIYEIIENPFFEGFDWESLLHRVLDPPFCPKENKISVFNYKKLDKIYLEEPNIAIPKEKDPFINLN